MREVVIGKNDAGQRLDKFLTKTLYGMPPALMYRLIRQKKIKVNRKRAEQKDNRGHKRKGFGRDYSRKTVHGKAE